MKGFSKNIITFIILFLIIGGFVFYLFQRSLEPSLELPQQKYMKLTSPTFENNQSMPSKYTCDGDNVNPPLEIKNVPQGTKGLILIVDDPDAPLGTWLHWTIWNINPSTSLIEENKVPEGAIEGKNDFGKNSYGGPCPPSGTHHYHFKLYALDKTLELDSSSKKDAVEKAMTSHILDWAELIGLYKRQ